MSSPLSEQLVEDFLESNFQSNCLAYAAAALLAYYVVLNLPYDVQYLWRRRSIATLLSAMNWLGIAGNLITYMPLATNTSPRCTAFGYANQMLYIVTVAISPLVAALRVHAVSGRNWYLVLPVWLLGIVPVGATIVGTSNMTRRLRLTRSIIVERDTRDLPYIPSTGMLVIISRTSVIVSDILVVGATWYYISHTSSVKTQLVRDVWDAKPNLTTVMFRDGTLYFLYSVISLLNIVELLVNIIGFNSPYRNNRSRI
ncbi:predicted protein [Postia placenta Mad-698-R]|nr:predicted protein [Postia placenta Mad-698-R]